MVAFGEMLIEYWGGDLDRYRGTTYSTPTVDKRTPAQKEKERIKFAYEYK